MTAHANWAALLLYQTSPYLTCYDITSHGCTSQPGCLAVILLPTTTSVMAAHASRAALLLYSYLIRHNQSWLHTPVGRPCCYTKQRHILFHLQRPENKLTGCLKEWRCCYTRYRHILPATTLSVMAAQASRAALVLYQISSYLTCYDITSHDCTCQPGGLAVIPNIVISHSIFKNQRIN